jgi:hypothetical protein
MKVFVFTNNDYLVYGRGVGVVAGNSKEEAFGCLMEYIKENEYPSACNYFCTSAEYCKEIDSLILYNAEKPKVIAFSIYEE